MTLPHTRPSTEVRPAPSLLATAIYPAVALGIGAVFVFYGVRTLVDGIPMEYGSIGAMVLLLVLTGAAFGYALIAGHRLAQFRQCRAVEAGSWGIAFTLPERPERPVVVAAADVVGVRVRRGNGFRLGWAQTNSQNRPWPFTPARVLDVRVRDDRAYLHDPAIDLLRDDAGEPGVWSYPLIGFRPAEVVELLDRVGAPSWG
ncbi:hypothetical protein EV383_4548 [Pseudonocardia sediminis]|uniref:Uncharacterized protein n=1 Tax=Pseudonocardia sediminis TaxID=1397368 RepID=A0A4Q7UZP1_PSEST|nr:hypothetical protein [Pseudonocardia sediminis]RZT87622.1 hypothetical protein EV383_4548 [Pseudonocardia sediminis]